MSEAAVETLEDMFLDMFAGWRNRIEKMEKVNADELFVELTDGRQYRFGVKPNRDVYLQTISSQK